MVTSNIRYPVLNEMEAQSAFVRIALNRDQAMQDGRQGIEWHEMKAWLRSTTKVGASRNALQSSTYSKVDQ